ncbi:MAG: winged helix-turn-helix transcriptional regulator [Candidatus Lokiarchaeota archaeon]|nr:winged helix-turn-helix transcriptional regulator [Candidatus Lokiarchaeota archaeon]
MTFLDEKDLQIIALLQENARYSTKEMYQKSGIPQTTIYNRIKRLRERGVITRFTIELDRKKMGRGLLAYIMCTVSYRTSKGKKIDQYQVAELIRQFSEVEEVSIVTGETDLIVRVALKDVEALNEFVISKLRDIDGIEKTKTSVVLSLL